uniref:Uncharacterized protein n=1 Tax=Romanomermis culicivorax TaxID=13658 RepID=A0A915ILC7_ROMCU
PESLHKTSEFRPKSYTDYAEQPGGFERPKSPVVTSYDRREDASGASTKSQTHGSYVDEHGNQVNYVKEVYTSSDPGSQYSMLTQEEKKALEEPLEPGVVSRHVTSKYYKRSTYTSQTTTSSTPSAPAVSYPTAASPPSSYRVGQLGPGVSQF